MAKLDGLLIICFEILYIFTVLYANITIVGQPFQVTADNCANAHK